MRGFEVGFELRFRIAISISVAIHKVQTARNFARNYKPNLCVHTQAETIGYLCLLSRLPLGQPITLDAILQWVQVQHLIVAQSRGCVALTLQRI